MKIRKKAESLFAWIGRTSAHKPWLYILFSLFMLGGSLWQMQYLIIDTTTEGFLKKDDPAIKIFNSFKSEFGRDEQFIISVETDDYYKRDFIAKIVELHKALALKVPYVDEVNSLYNARMIYGDEGDLIVKDLLEELPANDAEWAPKAKDSLHHPLYKNVYISDDGRLVNIYIRPNVTFPHKDSKTGQVTHEVLGEIQIHEMVLAIREVAKDFPELEKTMRMAGTPVLTEELSRYLVGDMLKFISLAILVIGTVLFILFRTVWGIFLPLIVVITALISTMALMQLTDQPVQSATVILPSFILAVGISDAIHLLSIFVQRMHKGEDKATALEYALEHCGLPIFFTIITTAAGLFSFGGSDIVPVANIGWFSAAGVFFAFFYTILLLPALIAITPIHLQPETEKPRKTWIDSFIAFSLNLACKHSVAIVIASGCIAAASLYGASQLHFSHDPIKWLPQDSPGRQAILLVSKKIGGTVPVEIVIDTGVPDGVKDADFMRALNETAVYLETYRTEQLAVGKVLSVATLLKETNKALFDNDPNAYVIPDNRELIAQEFLMLESSGAKDLFKLVDTNYQKARITVLTPWVDALYFGDYIRGIEKILQEKFDGKASVEITGMVPMLAKTLKKIMQATAWSYVFAFTVITIMMIILLESFKYGFISVLPNVLPITMVMALMHVNGAPLDMFSMLIGSIAMGLAVDDTVHFMDGFRNVYGKTGNAYVAIAETMDVSGRAMLSTGTVLALGFLIYLFSPMQNLQDFGLYTALCILIAMFADFWMTPALLLLLHRKDNNFTASGVTKEVA